jgi:hypothetical protein
MFNLTVMLNLDLTDSTLQTALVEANKNNIQIEVNEPIVSIWLHDLQLKAEIVNNKIVRLINLKNSVEIYHVDNQKGYIQDIADLEAAKVGKCLLITTAYDKKIQSVQMTLTRLGEFFDHIISGGLN